MVLSCSITSSAKCDTADADKENAGATGTPSKKKEGSSKGLQGRGGTPVKSTKMKTPLKVWTELTGSVDVQIIDRQHKT